MHVLCERHCYVLYDTYRWMQVSRTLEKTAFSMARQGMQTNRQLPNKKKQMLKASRWVRQAMLLKFEATEIIASWCFISPLVARKLRPA